MSTNTPSWTPTFVALEASKTLNKEDLKCVIRMVSYNVLAQIYIKRADFPTSPESCLRWKNRSRAIVSCLLSLNADFLCVQELDKYDTFYKMELIKEGYDSVYVQRGNKRQDGGSNKRDGCCIFFRQDRISLLTNDVIDYNELVPKISQEGDELEYSSDVASTKQGDINDVQVRFKRDCVGVLAAFKLIDAPSHVLIIACTHIFWDPVLMDIKLAQVRYLAKRLLTFHAQVREEFGVEPLILVGGDFNSLPGDTVYNYVTSGADERSNMKSLGLHEALALVDKNNSFEIDGDDVGFSGRFPCPLVSVYAYLDKEPPATNHTQNFVGTLDYIFFIPSQGLKPISHLMLPPRDAPQVVAGLPNKHHPSDHLPIGADFGIV